MGDHLYLANLDQVNSFLHYNYLPKGRPDNCFFERVVKFSKELLPDLAGIDFKDQQKLIEIGVKYLKKAIESRAEPDKTYIVPLSGGLDSRAILAGLIEMGLKNKIITVTMGVPESYDYEIGKYVAEKMVVKNEPLNLNQIPISFDQLLNAAGSIDNCAYLFSAYYHHAMFKRYGADVVFFNGILGGELAGQNLPKSTGKDDDWETSVTRFNKADRYWKPLVLTEPGFEVNKMISSTPFTENTHLNYADQLVLGIRQQYCLAPVLMPEGFRQVMPFLDDHWLSYILNIPLEYRKREYLYKKILQKAFPKFYSLKVTNNLGLPLNAYPYRRTLSKIVKKAKALGYRLYPKLPFFLSPSTLLIDYNSAFREREDYKSIIHESLIDLKKREIIDWLDIERLWKEHQLRQVNHTGALTALASLEFYLKTKRIET
jgi:asparagine synthetase B (glutamine-hydrolysing)